MSLYYARVSKDGHRAPFVAEKVIFGEEYVVNPNRFCEDPEHEDLEDRNHVTVCKPTAAGPDPLTKAIDVLAGAGSPTDVAV